MPITYVKQGDNWLEILPGGGTTEAESLPPPSNYWSSLRNSGGIPVWRKHREAYINDRNDIDATGVSDTAPAFQTYLREYATAGILHIWCDGGSTYRLNSTVYVPGGLWLQGPSSRGGGTYPAYGGKAIFRPGANNISLLKMSPDFVNPGSNGGARARIKGLSIQLGNSAGYTGVVGVYLDTVSLVVIEDCMFESGHATSTAIKGGACLYIEIQHNTFQSLLGRGIDMLDAYENVAYYGINVGWIHHNIMSGQLGAIRVDGTVDIYSNDFEAGSGDIGPAIEVGSTGTYYNGAIRDNYFEAGSYYVLVQNNASQVEFSGNKLYGVLVPGSYGFKVASPVIGKLVAINNWMTSVETGYDLSATYGNVWMEANDFGPNVTTHIHAPSLIGRSTPATTSEPARISNADNLAIMQSGSLYGGALTWNDGDGLVIDLKEGRTWNVDMVVGGTLLPLAGSFLYGMAFKLFFKKGTVTLPTASWHNASGVDELVPANTWRSYRVNYDGFIYETGRRGYLDYAPMTKTAAFTAREGETPLYRCDATTAAFTVTLPDARNSFSPHNFPMTFRKVDATANIITLDLFSVSLFEGGTVNPTLKEQGDWITVAREIDSGTTATSGWYALNGNHLYHRLEIDGALDHDGTTVGFYGATPVVKPTALTAADNGAFDTGDASANAVLSNVRTRTNELETKIRALGLLT